MQEQGLDGTKQVPAAGLQGLKGIHIHRNEGLRPADSGKSPFFLRPAGVFLAVILLLLLAWWAYAPGLTSGFLFDDFNNLNQIGDYGPVDNLRTLAFYLTSGSADPIGRPLSLLSFLIDARNWPADPEPFKRTNILLHLTNGVLLALVLLRLGRRLALPEAQVRAAAVLGSAFWTLHPLLVSTTLYVVQREAMLPVTFSLLGILLWVKGSDDLVARRPHAIARMIIGAWGCTALAMLCKANGVLLPVLLAGLEWIIPAGAPGVVAANAASITRLRRIRWLLLGLPGLLVAGWLLSKVPLIFEGEIAGRPWSLGQRLLSEARAVCDYLGLLWIPQATGSSIFNDGFTVSRDWLHPWSTLPSLAAIVVLLGAGFALRRRQPAISFAIVFYFAGHLLESTVIPLELYFEHRNYLPALPMFWPLALWLTGTGMLHKIRLAFAMALLLILAALCHARAGIWGKPYEQALLLAQTDPQSPRAQANAAAYEMAHGRPDLAASRLARVSREMPDEAQIALNWVAADCAMGALSMPARDAAHHALGRDRSGSVLVENWLSGAIQTAREKTCNGLDLNEIETMLRTAQGNPHYGSSGVYYAEFQAIHGQLALARGDGAEALRVFDSGLAAFPTPDRALLQAAQLGSADFPALALAHLRYSRTLKMEARGGLGMPWIHFWLLERWGYWSGEFARMQSQLEQDVRQAQHPSAAGPRS